MPFRQRGTTALTSYQIDAMRVYLSVGALLQIQIVVTVFPTSKDDRYSAVKKVCYHEKGLAAQAINSKTLGNDMKLKAIVVKIALQMNVKLGGVLWALDIPMVSGCFCRHDGCCINTPTLPFVQFPCM